MPEASSAPPGKASFPGLAAMRIGVFIIMAGAAATPSRMIGEGAETAPDGNDGIVYRLGFQDLSAGIFKTAAAAVATAAEQDVNRAPIPDLPGTSGIRRGRGRARPDAPIGGFGGPPRFTEILGAKRLTNTKGP